MKNCRVRPSAIHVVPRIGAEADRPNPYQLREARTVQKHTGQEAVDAVNSGRLRRHHQANLRCEILLSLRDDRREWEAKTVPMNAGGVEGGVTGEIRFERGFWRRILRRMHSCSHDISRHPMNNPRSVAPIHGTALP
jgi:hypothetical protein